MISLEKVPNILARALKMTNSRDLLSVEFTGQAFRPYSKTGKMTDEAS